MSAKRSIKSATNNAKGKDGKSVSKPRKKAADLEKEIIVLHDELERVNDQLQRRNDSYEQIVKKIFANVSCELFDIDETTDPMDYEIDDVMEMLSSILTRNYGDGDTIEVRVEELETRVTKQNLDIAKLSKQLLYAQYALEDIVKTNLLNDAKQLAEEALKKIGSEQNKVTPVAPLHYLQTTEGTQIVAPSTPRDVITANSETVHVSEKPIKRLPGTTHINDMKPELRYLVIKELSFNRTSGCDWRLFAERVGIQNDVVDRLRQLRVQYPMAKILTVWGESSGATVRMLHRHLISPQLRCSILARHLADSYEVD